MRITARKQFVLNAKLQKYFTSYKRHNKNNEEKKEIKMFKVDFTRSKNNSIQNDDMDSTEYMASPYNVRNRIKSTTIVNNTTTESTKIIPKEEISQTKILLCAIGKMENNYIREWVEHYYKLGFTNICLYDNNDIGGERFEDVIEDYIDSGFVILENARGKKCYQIPSYNLCMEKYRDKYDWIAFFDIDEFIELDKKYNNIIEFVNDKKFNSFDAIKVCWENYDDNGLLSVQDNNYSVTRFTHPIVLDKESKSIVRTTTQGTFRKDNPHALYGEHIKVCNAVGVPCINLISIGSKTTHEGAKLKHYRFKTLEEYITNKMVRLWATSYKDGGKKGLTLDFFFKFNKKTKEKEEFARKVMEQKSHKPEPLKIAIVGNAPCALGKGKGEEIDSHDIVLRMNNFQIQGYSQDLGKKTDMMAVVSVIKKYPKTEEFLKLPKEMRIFRDDKNPKDNFPLEVVFGGKVKEEDVVRVDDWIYKVKNRMKGYKQNHFPSTGLVMMQYLVDKYPTAQIDAYAVSFFKEKKIHIYDNKSGEYHDRNKEMWYFDKYLKEHITLHDFEMSKINPTVAIVGNAPITKEYGKEVDSHDLVFRINDYKIKGYEKFIGTKTTDIVFTTRTPFMDEILKMPKEHKIFFYVKETKELLNSRLDEIYNGKMRLDGITVADNKLYYKKLTKDMYDGKLDGRIHPSTGLMTIQYVVDNYPNSKIDVYGITFFEDKTKNATCIHLDGSVRRCPHNGSAEKRYYEKYLKNKINLKK